MQPLAAETLIVKRRHSAFFGTDLEVVLRSLEIDTVVVTGSATSISVLCTALDAAARDYRTFIVSDRADRGWLGAVTADPGGDAQLLTVDGFANLVMEARL